MFDGGHNKFSYEREHFKNVTQTIVPKFSDVQGEHSNK